MTTTNIALVINGVLSVMILVLAVRTFWHVLKLPDRILKFAPSNSEIARWYVASIFLELIAVYTLGIAINHIYNNFIYFV